MICAAARVTDPVAIFLNMIAIIMLAPVILKNLKIPHIIGLIVAGVAVGPYGLDILDRDSSFTIFGQVGLLYLMFLAGLEIDMYHLRKNIRKGILFGLLTFFIPMVMGVLASVYILHVSWLTSFLLASMYASHTLIAYPVAARFGITKAPSVLISVVGTIIAVVGALLVLAGAVNIFDTGSFQPSGILWLFGKLTLYCLAVLYAYPRLTRRFFKQYSEKVTQYVFVLVMVFLSAWVSGAIGLEPVLGAFFAGLVLNRYIPANSPLMNSIEFVGNALFIPYFLIGVGMMINVGVIVKGNTLAIATVMLIVALLSKWIAAWIAQLAYRMDASDRRMMFGLTTAHTAVALAVVTIGYNMILPDGTRMMGETILNGTVLVILFTCAIAPIVTSQAASKIKIRMLEDRPDSSHDDASAVSVSHRTVRHQHRHRHTQHHAGTRHKPCDIGYAPQGHSDRHISGSQDRAAPQRHQPHGCDIAMLHTGQHSHTHCGVRPGKSRIRDRLPRLGHRPGPSCLRSRLPHHILHIGAAAAYHTRNNTP